MKTDVRSDSRAPWFRIAGGLAILTAIWFVAANVIWSPADPPFWAFLVLVAALFSTVISAAVGLVTRSLHRRSR